MFIRKNAYFKFLFGTVAVTAVAISWLSSSNNLSTIKKEISIQAFDIVKDARANINEKLNQKHKPYLIRNKFKFDKDNKPLSSTLKSYYPGYREACDFKEKHYQTDSNLNIDRTEIFVYRSSDKNQILQFDPKHRK